MITVTIRYVNGLGEDETVTQTVAAPNVWAAINLARIEFVKDHPRAVVREVAATGPKI